MFGLEAGEQWLLGFIKRAIEKFELDLLAMDAKVKSSALAMLDPHVGNWTGTMTTWLMPGEPYDVQNVTSTAQWSVGGKFLHRTITGKFLNKPFEAVCLIGHDDARDEYVASWMDSATTAMMPLKGGHDSDTRTLTMEGSIQLVSDTGVLGVRTVLTMDDNDHLRCLISLGRFGIYFKAHQIDLARVTTSS
jgi:uncharacterized protein DUF1579